MRDIFNAKTVARGGVVRRNVSDVLRHVSQEEFLEDVRQRGFRLIKSGSQYIVVCSSGDIEIIC